MKAALYARVSTEDQVGGTSLDDQRRACLAEIERRGWTLADEYVDEGISGTDANRPAWRRMLADAKARDIDAVVVAKLDRFARKASDILTETDRFLEAGVGFVVVEQNLDLATPAGRMMRTVLAGVAEMERDMIVARTVQGQRSKARSGGWPGGEPPYGWTLTGTKREGRPVPADDERRTIALAYNLIVKRRMPAPQVADLLNAQGHRPRKAARWSAEVLRRCLANPTLYTGGVVWGLPSTSGRYKRSHHTKVDPATGQPKYGDPVKVTLPNPPLTKAQHEALLRQFAKRAAKVPAQAPETQLLSLRLYGQCGQHYYGVALSGKAYNVYRCAGRKHARGLEKCSCPQVQAEAVDARVWAEVEGVLGDPDRLRALARQWLALPDDDGAPAEATVTELDAQVVRLERALDRAEEKALLADDPTTFERVAAKVRADLTDARNRRSMVVALQQDAQARADRLTDLAALAERARGRLATMAPAERREVVEILEVRVMMGGEVVRSEPEHITITGTVDPRMLAPESEQLHDGAAWRRSGSRACWW